MNEVVNKTNEKIGLVATDEIRLLIFKIMDVCFGADMEQIEEMIDYSEVQQKNWDIRYFAEAVCFRNIEVEYKKPKVILIKDKDQDIGIVIDEPEKIENINFQSIKLLPPLLGDLETQSAIWAAAIWKEDLILLIDFYRLQKALPKIKSLDNLEKVGDNEIESKKIIKRGDIIVQVNQKPVWMTEQIDRIYKLAQKNKKKSVVLLVERAGDFRFFFLPVKE